MSLQPSGVPIGLDQAQLHHARYLARRNRRSVLVELEHLHIGRPEELVAQLGALFAMTAIDHAGMLALAPAFDLVPLTLALEWNCLLLRESDGTLVGVVADPFDPELQLWLNQQAHVALIIRLTSSADLRERLRDLGALGRTGAMGTDCDAEAGEGDSGAAVKAEEIAGAVLRQAMRQP